MKIEVPNLRAIALALGLFAGSIGLRAQIPVYPILTNTVFPEVAVGSATIASNGLLAVLAGTNICFQMVSSNGASLGPLTVIGHGTSIPLVAAGGGKYLVLNPENFARLFHGILLAVIQPGLSGAIRCLECRLSSNLRK